ncbi:MAG: sugar phosphate nucleotidyltransferase [Candidatus Paceibacterota bacterium]|jgi:bifunctional UDP-N-acetylglucosamine pyrophosphorylase/glucosamine-1-phosphate N-acetyltransferase
MDNIPKQAIILAAGESSRLWPLNSKHKSLLRIMGKPLIWYTIEGLRTAGIEDIVVVQGPKRDIEEDLKDFSDLGNVKYVIQPEANGMSGAMAAAKPYANEQFFILFAHAVDCLDVVKKMLEKSRQTGAKMVLAGQATNSPWLYGAARLEGDRIYEIVEKPIEGKEPSNIKINGIYLFESRYFDYLQKTLGTTHFNQEFEAAASAYAKENDSRIVVLDKDYKGISLKYPWHLFGVQKYIFDKFLIKQTIAKSARIAKSAIIIGNVYIGDNVEIHEGAVIKGPCYVGDNSVIGNNSIVRDHCDLEKGAIIGALCEAARVIFQPDVHVHSGYFGDSIIDSGCRVGAGTVTANARLDRDEIKAQVKREKNGEKRTEMVGTGLKSLGIIVGQNSKVGINASLMPGRMIGKDCVVGPGTVLMENLQDGEKAV